MRGLSFVSFFLEVFQRYKEGFFFERRKDSDVRPKVKHQTEWKSEIKMDQNLIPIIEELSLNSEGIWCYGNFPGIGKNF